MEEKPMETMIQQTDPNHDFGAEFEELTEALTGLLDSPERLEARAAWLRAENAVTDARGLIRRAAY